MVDQEGLVLIDDTFLEKILKLRLRDLCIRIGLRIKKDFSNPDRQIPDQELIFDVSVPFRFNDG